MAFIWFCTCGPLHFNPEAFNDEDLVPSSVAEEQELAQQVIRHQHFTLSKRRLLHELSLNK